MQRILLVVLCALAGQIEAEDMPSTFRDCRDCPAMVVIPAGQYLPGSALDEPDGQQTPVDVPAFALGVFEITNAEFGRFVLDTGYPMRDGCYTDRDRDGLWTWDDTAIWSNLGGTYVPEFPASCIDWHAASTYVHWLGLRTGAHYRLPTENEFEYARTAGGDGPYGDGVDVQRLCDHGNVPDAALNAVSPQRFTLGCDDGFADIAPVGQFEPNPFGVHDLIGNVREWLQDCHDPGHDSGQTPAAEMGNANAPTGSAILSQTCESRRIHLGFWGGDLPDPQSTGRGGEAEGALFDGIGLRVARNLDGARIVPDWDLRVYENVEHGVSLLYPSAYQSMTEVSEDHVFVAASPNSVPRMDLMIVAPQQVDELVQAKTFVSSLGGDSIDGIELLASVSTTLADGETPANAISFNWVHLSRGLMLRTVMLSTVRDGHRFSVFITARHTHDWADLEKLAYTLRLLPPRHALQ